MKSNAALYNPNNIDYAETESSFSVYPNPASEQLWLNLPDYFNEEVTINVYNQLGQLVVEQVTREIHTPTLNLDVGALHPGAYWVEVISNGERQTARVIVE